MTDRQPDHFSHRVTLKDIAVKAKLSVASVSMALRDNPRLPASTVDRVKLLAEELGYVPDPALSALAAHRSRVRVFRDFSVVALVSNWSTKDAWASLPSAQQFIEGARARARELGYSLQHHWAKADGVSAARFSDILRARGIRGVLLAPSEFPETKLELDWESFSVVTMERNAQFHHLVPNHYEDLLLCWKKVRSFGYERVGLAVRKDLAIRWSNQWEAAYAYACANAKKNLVSIPTLELSEDNPVKQLREWIRAYRPQVVIGRCDNFIEAANAEGLEVPRDIGYVSLNLIDDVPEASGIDQHRGIMGAVAIDVLNSLLQRNQSGFQPASIGTQIDGTWRVGSTLSKAVPQPVVNTSGE
ncbi:LacI family transcriptional regulator [Puniceicoccaceae bacterium K14]|nr:LacI family transcriptional regulator [Puniceicoccaceae bacterium K14]